MYVQFSMAILEQEIRFFPHFSFALTVSIRSQVELCFLCTNTVRAKNLR